MDGNVVGAAVIATSLSCFTFVSCALTNAVAVSVLIAAVSVVNSVEVTGTAFDVSIDTDCSGIADSFGSQSETTILFSDISTSVAVLLCRGRRFLCEMPVSGASFVGAGRFRIDPFIS